MRSSKEILLVSEKKPAKNTLAELSFKRNSIFINVVSSF